MQTYLKKYKFQNLLIILELICTNLLLLASTLITMRMARLVMDGDFKGIVICSLLIIVIYLILHFLFWKNDVHTTKVIACMNQDMRRDLNRRILAAGTQELGEYDTGEYISWYTNNLKEAENIFIQDFPRKVDYVAVSINSDMEDLLQKAMNQNFVPVVDDQKKFIGIVTRKSIMEYCYEKLKNLPEDY